MLRAACNLPPDTQFKSTKSKYSRDAASKHQETEGARDTVVSWHINLNPTDAY